MVTVGWIRTDNQRVRYSDARSDVHEPGYAPPRTPHREGDIASRTNLGGELPGRMHGIACETNLQVIDILGKPARWISPPLHPAEIRSRIVCLTISDATS
jgi:hypothetical protein